MFIGMGICHLVLSLNNCGYAKYIFIADLSSELTNSDGEDFNPFASESEPDFVSVECRITSNEYS